MKFLSISCLLLLLESSLRTSAEVFTAITEVEPLLETHKRIIDDLDDYIRKEEKRLLTLKKQLNIYRREHYKAMEDIPNYLGNPINAFTLIKRLTTDLDFIEDSINIGTEYIKNVTVNHADVKYPVLEDLAGAAQALTRLQETYLLDVEELAEGMLNGVVYSSPMTAADCYEMGRALYNEKDFKSSLEWMGVAHKKFMVESQMENHPFSEVDILEYISFSHYMLGEVREALTWTEKLLQMEPNHKRARGNIPHYKKAIAKDDEKFKRRRRGDTGEDEVEEQTVEVELTGYQKERKIYEALCRGEMDIPSEVAKKLKCRYVTENHPFLRYAPFKMEEVYLNPNVYIYYDVMSDDEIEFVQEMAKPRLKRAVVHDPKTGEMIKAHYRISKSGWLRDEESPIIARISQRVADMTGLSMDFAEELQVVNYGIGGHYEPHYDFARALSPEKTVKSQLLSAIRRLNLLDEQSLGRVRTKVPTISGIIQAYMPPPRPIPTSEPPPPPLPPPSNQSIAHAHGKKSESVFKKFGGNRIATVLFYMSDVAQGGATVFTELGLSVFPVKGAAAFWLNLHPSGEGDLATRHAACPVLRGSKWVSNKWIHQGGQEFIKPCNLEYQAEAILHKIPRPIPKTSR